MDTLAPLLDLSSQLIAASQEAGADHAEVYLRHGPSTSITYQQDHLSTSDGWQGGLALQVWRENRRALITSSNVAPANLAALARQAVQLARQHGVESPPSLHQRRSDRQALPAMEEQVPIEEKRALIEQVRRIVSDSRLFDQVIFNASYSDVAQWTVLVNSYGFREAYWAQRYNVWFWVEGDGGHVVAAASSRHWADLDRDALIRYLNERAALMRQPACQVQSTSCEVLLSPSAAADLVRSLGMLLTAENVLRGARSLLRYIGMPIASPAVTLIDDGTLANGFKSRPIDDEGTPTSMTRLIDAGRMVGLLHTLRTAAQLNMRPNGSATRVSLWDQPRAVPSNIYLQPGDADPVAMRQELRRGLIVEAVMRPGRIHNASGKFMLVAHGMWVEQGEPARTVSGVRLSANVFELLRNVRRSGTDLTFSSLADGAGAPSLLIDRMQVG